MASDLSPSLARNLMAALQRDYPEQKRPNYAWELEDEEDATLFELLTAAHTIDTEFADMKRTMDASASSPPLHWVVVRRATDDDSSSTVWCEDRVVLRIRAYCKEEAFYHFAVDFTRADGGVASSFSHAPPDYTAPDAIYTLLDAAVHPARPTFAQVVQRFLAFDLGNYEILADGSRHRGRA